MQRYKVNREFGVEVGGVKYDLGKSFDTEKLVEKKRAELDKAVEKGELAEDLDIEKELYDFKEEMDLEVSDLVEQGYVISKDEMAPDEEAESDLPAPKKKGKKGGRK